MPRSARSPTICAPTAFPTDVIWIDIDYQDRNRPFTVNNADIPGPAKLDSDMDAKGIRLVAITDLHIAYLRRTRAMRRSTAALAGNDFVHNADGNLYVAPVWPGPSVFPDFTRSSDARLVGRRSTRISSTTASPASGTT